VTPHSLVNPVTIKSRVPKLMALDDGKDDMDSYLRRFESYATAQGWLREN